MNTIRHLNTIIRRMEDNLLTSKNPYEIEEIQRCLQKKDWNFRKWNEEKRIE